MLQKNGSETNMKRITVFDLCQTTYLCINSITPGKVSTAQHVDLKSNKNITVIHYA